MQVREEYEEFERSLGSQLPPPSTYESLTLPWARELAARGSKSRQYIAVVDSGLAGQVLVSSTVSLGKSYDVNVLQNSCQCAKFLLDRVPCVHLLCARSAWRDQADAVSKPAPPLSFPRYCTKEAYDVFVGGSGKSNSFPGTARETFGPADYAPDDCGPEGAWMNLTERLRRAGRRPTKRFKSKGEVGGHAAMPPGLKESVRGISRRRKSEFKVSQKPRGWAKSALREPRQAPRITRDTPAKRTSRRVRTTAPSQESCSSMVMAIKTVPSSSASFSAELIRFLDRMKMKIAPVPADGNCGFHAVAAGIGGMTTQKIVREVTAREIANSIVGIPPETLRHYIHGDSPLHKCEKLLETCTTPGAWASSDHLKFAALGFRRNIVYVVRGSLRGEIVYGTSWNKRNALFQLPTCDDLSPSIDFGVYHDGAAHFQAIIFKDKVGQMTEISKANGFAVASAEAKSDDGFAVASAEAKSDDGFAESAVGARSDDGFAESDDGFAESAVGAASDDGFAESAVGATSDDGFAESAAGIVSADAFAEDAALPTVLATAKERPEDVIVMDPCCICLDAVEPVSLPQQKRAFTRSSKRRGESAGRGAHASTPFHTPCCGKVLHAKCMKAWAFTRGRKRATCPHCRSPITQRENCDAADILIGCRAYIEYESEFYFGTIRRRSSEDSHTYFVVYEGEPETAEDHSSVQERLSGSRERKGHRCFQGCCARGASVLRNEERVGDGAESGSHREGRV
eukprot:scaffold5222_cov293-Pinguiococcus_pyrenoidosus.AAC.10